MSDQTIDLNVIERAIREHGLDAVLKKIEDVLGHRYCTAKHYGDRDKARKCMAAVNAMQRARCDIPDGVDGPIEDNTAK